MRGVRAQPTDNAPFSEMAQRATQFAYNNIELYKSESLGSGSYGGVCKAKCDGLLCAAKIMHPTLFDLRDPGTASYLRKFREECHLLSLARHPNVVQYLGIYTDPDTRLPVLLMELCDESLTSFLERSPGPLSYHVQVNICHDIALALVYLHSNGLLHRDLTGNNILIISGTRAKITDFGMSKLATVNPRMTALTLCPGNRLYMAPEALDEAKSYTAKLDIFSFGVIVIQILTRLFPNPTDRFRTKSSKDEVSDEEEEGSEVRQVVPEMERRAAHLQLIPDTHSLKPIALQCLKKKERLRPSALELSERFSELKISSQYTESIHQAQSVTRQLQHKYQEVEEQQLQVAELNSVVEGKETELHEKDRQLQEKQQTIEEKDRQLQEKQQTIEEKDRQLQEQQQTIEEKDRQLQEKQQTIEEKDRQLQEQQQTIEEKDRQLQEQQQTIEEKDRQFQEQQQTIEEKNRQLQEQQQTIEEKNRQLQEIPRSKGTTAAAPDAVDTTMSPHSSATAIPVEIASIAVTRLILCQKVTEFIDVVENHPKCEKEIFFELTGEQYERLDLNNEYRFPLTINFMGLLKHWLDRVNKAFTNVVSTERKIFEKIKQEERKIQQEKQSGGIIGMVVRASVRALSFGEVRDHNSHDLELQKLYHLHRDLHMLLEIMELVRGRSCVERLTQHIEVFCHPHLLLCSTRHCLKQIFEIFGQYDFRVERERILFCSES